MAQRPLPGISPRRPLNTKMSDDIRARLQAAADASDRTLSHEIEHRLERSMRDESQFGDPETAAVLRDLAGYIVRAEHLEGRKLLDTTDPLKDEKLDRHVRWLLGQTIKFRRAMRALPNQEAIWQQAEDDDAKEPNRATG